MGKWWPWRARKASVFYSEEGDSESFEAYAAGYGNKISAAKSELNKSNPAPRLHPLLLGGAITLLVLVVALVTEYIMYDRSQSAVKDMIRSNLKRLARAAASLVDPKLHQTFTDPQQESSASYKSEIAKLGQFQNSDEEIAFVYTVVQKQGKVYFVLDPTPAGDENGDGLEEKSHIMEEYPEAQAELLFALNEGKAAADIKPYRDRWGTFISGYAPIRDSAGTCVGLVGIDLSAEHYEKRLSAIREAYNQAVWITVLLALLSGLLAGAVQAKAVKIHRESADRDRRYKEQIRLTLERVESAIKIAEVSRNRFSDLFEGIPVSCLTFDRSGKVFEFNSQALRAFGLQAQGLIERDLRTVLGDDLYGQAQSELVESVLNGKAFNDRIWGEDGRHYLFSGHPLYGPEGEITGGILAAVDISLQKAAEDRVQSQLEDLNKAHQETNEANEKLQAVVAKLEEAATTDLLTGLPNRRAFYEALQVSLAKAERGHPFALVQADIDYFKLFNDVYGHHAGDQVLQLFAET